MTEITYLMDSDPGGSGYFTEAKGYFSARSQATVVTAPAGKARTLEEVFTDLGTRAGSGTVFPVINLVSHATGFSSLEFPISDAHRDDDAGLITVDTLKNAINKAGTNGFPSILGAPAVTASTSVCLYGCDVGRDPAFMVMLGQLFGPELTIYAPLRVAVFRHTGTTHEHRLARTWSVNHDRDVRKTTTWDPVRTVLADKLVAKFTGAGDPTVEPAIRAAAQTATATSPGSFFFSERMETADDPSTHSISASSVVLPAGTVDDTTVPVSLTSADFKPDPANPGVWTAWVASLGQVLEEPVSITDAAQFRKTVIKTQRTASVTPLVPANEPTSTNPVEEPMSELYGKYRATVTGANSPTGQGRLQVDVPAAGVTGAWAEASLPPIPTSLLRLPSVGATVWVEFEAGDVNLPIWTGATWDDTPATDLTLVSEGTLTLQAPVVKVQAQMTEAAGIVKSQAIITESVVSAAYTPGAGNIW